MELPLLLANTTPIQRSCIESVLECVPADQNPFRIANLHPTHHRQSAGSHPVSSRRRRDETHKNISCVFSRKSKSSILPQRLTTRRKHLAPTHTGSCNHQNPSWQDSRFEPRRIPHLSNFVLDAYRVFPFGFLLCVHRVSYARRGQCQKQP